MCPLTNQNICKYQKTVSHTRNNLKQIKPWHKYKINQTDTRNAVEVYKLDWTKIFIVLMIIKLEWVYHALGLPYDIKAHLKKPYD